MLGDLLSFVKEKKFIVAVMTAIGSMGGFPSPPEFMQKLFHYRFVQYILLGVLIMQGGGGMDLKFTLKVLALVVLVFEGGKYFEEKRKTT